MPTLHIGPLGSEELRPKVKGFTFIVIVDSRLENPARLFPGTQAKIQKSKDMTTQSMSRRFNRHAHFLYRFSSLGEKPPVS